MNKSESIKHLAEALANAQAEIGDAVKDSKNPHFKNNYASLTEVLAVAKSVLPKHGLSFCQFPAEAGRLVTILMHSSGEYIEQEASTPLSKNDPQGVGSALTYLRRYSLKSVLGIGDADDDAEAAKADVRQAPKQQKQKLTFAEAVKTAGSVSMLFDTLCDELDEATAEQWRIAWDTAPDNAGKKNYCQQLYAQMP